MTETSLYQNSQANLLTTKQVFHQLFYQFPIVVMVTLTHNIQSGLQRTKSSPKHIADWESVESSQKVLF